MRRIHTPLAVLILILVMVMVMVLTASVTAAAAPSDSSDQNTRVLHGAYNEFAPLAYTNDDGKPAGAYIEKVEKLAERAGYRIRWQGLPIGRIYLYLRGGQLDFWLGSSGVPAISESVLEPDFTLTSIHLQAFYRNDTPAVDKLADLRKKRLILIRGYTYLDHIKPLRSAPGTRINKAPDHASALRMLKTGRGDYLLDFRRPVRQILKEQPLFHIRSNSLLQWETTLIFSRHTDNVEAIIRDFENAWHQSPLSAHN